MIFEKQNVLDNPKQRERFEQDAADALVRHYKRPIAILFSWQPGAIRDTIDLWATPQVLDEIPRHR